MTGNSTRLLVGHCGDKGLWLELSGVHYACISHFRKRRFRSRLVVILRKKYEKKGLKKKKEKRDRFENFVSAVALLTTNHLWTTLQRACI